MTRWGAGRARSGRASMGAAIGILVLLLVGLFVFSSNGGRLASGLRSFPVPNSQGLSASLMSISSWASLFTNLTSFPLPVVQVPPNLGPVNATSNWAGYIAAAGQGHEATYVKGTWVQPRASCSPNGASGLLVWVGLGGLSNSPVQQIGTMAYCNDGQVVYVAWYESYPIDGGVVLLAGLGISPGEQVSASVAYSSETNKYTYSISVSGQSPNIFSESYPGIGPPRSAEWIVEPPFGPHGFITMSNFGTATITGGHATIGNRPDAIAGFGQGSDILVRSEYSCSGMTKASPGPLTSASGFTVSWHPGGGC